MSLPFKLPNTFRCPNDKSTVIQFASTNYTYNQDADVLAVSFTCPKCKVSMVYNINNASSLNTPTVLGGLQVQPSWTRQGG